MSRTVYGYFVVRHIADDEVAHRVPVHYPADSRMTERVERGLELKVDPDRFYFEWEDADGHTS